MTRILSSPCPIVGAVCAVVFVAVFVWLWWRDWQIDHIGDAFTFEPDDLDYRPGVTSPAPGRFDGPEPLPHRRNGEP